MSDIASLIHGLVRACGPVTVHDITRELRVQSLTWEAMIPFERDIAVAEAINGMIRDGKIAIEIDLDSREVSFDQPADAVRPVTGQALPPDAQVLCGHCGRELVTIGNPCVNCGDVAECAE